MLLAAAHEPKLDPGWKTLAGADREDRVPADRDALAATGIFGADAG
jgi:hypothetical protein